MDRLDIKNLAKVEEKGLVSIYMPTHKTSPENQQDKIRFKNLLTKAKEKLKELEIENIDQILKPAVELGEQNVFWDHTTNGLALLLGSDDHHIIKMERTPKERVVVGERFHVLPLMNSYENLNDTFILDIAKDRFELFFGDATGIRDVEMEGVVSTFRELYPDLDNQYSLDATGGNVLFYRRIDKSELKDNEREKFFRYVAQSLKDFFGEDMPLVIFGTTENVAAFNAIADKLNVRTTIEKPMYSMSKDEASQTLRDVLRPMYIEDMGEKLEDARNKVAEDKGTDNLSRILKDAKTGIIQTLFVGTTYDDLDIDTRDELVQEVIQKDGEIVYIDTEENPFDEKILAVYRY